jgi:repressor LexA
MDELGDPVVRADATVAGRTVQALTQPVPQQLVFHFTDGSSLVLAHTPTGLSLYFASGALSTRAEALPHGRPATPVSFTSLQGQYLAFIHTYTLLHGVPPAEADLLPFFGVSPPVVHQHLRHLLAKGLLERTPGRPRSLRVTLPVHEIPALLPRRTA